MNDLLLCEYVCACVSVCLPVSPWLRNLPVTAFDTLRSVLRFKQRDAMMQDVGGEEKNNNFKSTV